MNGKTPSNGELDRRDFLRMAAAGGAAAYLAGCSEDLREEFFAKHFHELSRDELEARVAWLEKKYEADYGEKFTLGTENALDGVLFGYGLDLSRCVGCRRCVYACVAENNHSRSPQVQYIRVLELPKEKGIELVEADPYYETESVPRPGNFYMPVACMMCENSPCERVCPVGATWREPDGIVVVDYDWCIGCRYCMASCPYDARKFNWGDPQMQTGDRLAVRVTGVKKKGEGRWEVRVSEAEDAPVNDKAPQVMPTVAKRPFLDPQRKRFMTDTLPVIQTNPVAESTTTYVFEVTGDEAPAKSTKDAPYGYFLDAMNTDLHYLGNRPRKKGVVEKCHFCIQRTRKGLYPACVEICPVGARKFGNLLDPESEIRYIIQKKRIFVLKEELNTRPKFFYFYGA